MYKEIELRDSPQYFRATVLNYLCEARMKHGKIQSARRNGISIPGFIFFPYPACIITATWQTVVMQIPSLTSLLPTTLCTEVFSKR